MDMKRIFSILAVMLALASCKNKEDIFEVDDTLHRTGKVTLLASIEDFSTKAEMPATGHGAWKRDDMIAVQVSDGSFVEFRLDGTGDTKRAKFTGEIPEGLQLGSYAVYPADAVSYGNGKVSLGLPAERDYVENKFDGLMVARIGETWEIELKQMLSFVNVNFGNFPNGGSRLVLSEPGMRLSGNIEVELDNLIENGIRLQAGEGTLSYNLPSAGSKFSMQILLPVGEYRSLNAEILDKNGEVISSKELFTIPFNAERSAMKSIGCELEAVTRDVPDAIVLRGVVWMKGNLQRNSNAKNEGFQDGWEIAPAQWFNRNYDLKANGSYTYDPNAATQMRFDIDQNFCNHFNFGGIKEPYTNAAASMATPSGNLNICGKMYTDQACTNETSDFAAAAFGDLAYWASKGNYRLPTAEELATLGECDTQYGHYIAPDGIKIWGLLFTEPATEGSPVFNSIEIQITDEMLDKGLFLPLAGRRADSSVTVISFRTQGCYWSGNAVDKGFVSGMSWASNASGAEYEYSDFLEVLSSKATVGHVKGYAYDRRAGFLIRPVLAEGGHVLPPGDLPGTDEPGTDPEQPGTDPEQPAGGDVKVGSVSLTETATGSKVFEGTVDVAATSEFTISISGEEYGFASHSGAGGLGKITSANTSLPCYNFATAATAKSNLFYEVSRAIGVMAKISGGGNKFTTSLAAAGKALVRVDLNGATPKYYMELVKNADPSVVFHENFDLCTYGGDYMVAIAGTKDSAMDGVTPGSKGGVTANNPSFVFDYPIAGTASGGVASNTYLENRGFQGWVFEYAGERPGCLQLCSGSAPGNITTPKMSKLSAATDVTLRLDIARFSTTSVDPIKVVIVGGGEIVSGHVDIEAYKAAGTAAASKDYTIGAASFDIVDDQYCPHTLANGDADKPHSVFTFQVKGMTPDSKVLIDCPKGAKNAPRCFIFDIKVTK